MAEKILIISPVSLIPYHSGNRKRIRTVCSELMRMGYELDFYYTGFDEQIDREHTEFFNGRVIIHQVDRDPSSLFETPFLRFSEMVNGIKIKSQKWIRRIFDGPDSAQYNKSLYEYKNLRKLRNLQSEISGVVYKAVIVNYSVYSFYFQLFDKKVRKILDMHDCLTNRYQLFLKNGKKPVEWYSLRYRDEKKAILSADVIWAITADEQKYYIEMAGSESIQILNLRHLVPFTKIDSEGPKKRVLLIGSDNRLNYDGLMWFVSEVWPKITEIHSDAELMVAGSICNYRNEFKNHSGITFYGRYENDDEIYSKASICINPMQDGTGLKIKTLEALSHGKMVVSTFEGASGLSDLIDKGLYCSDDPDDWVDILDNVFHSATDIEKRVSNSEKTINKIYQDNLRTIEKSLQ